MDSISRIVSADFLRQGISILLPQAKATGSGFYLPDTKIPLLSEARISEVIDTLREASSNTASSFHWKDRAEFTIVEVDAYGAFERYFDGSEFTGQGDNPVTFKVGNSSPEVTAYLLCYVAQNPEITKVPRWSIIRNRARRILAQKERLSEDDTLLGLAAGILQVASLQISSDKPRSDFETLANSFLFHAAYNMDVSARIGVHRFLQVPKIQKIRRNSSASLDAPRKTYTPDLVQHYIMGVAAEFPLLEYLSYYHIAEHHFEQVFHEDLIEQVREKIADPSFSVRRAKDVQGVIRTIDKAQRQIKEEGGVNEQRALQLVIDRFVDITRLIDDLNAYDPTLSDYYKSNGVPFAGAEKLNLTEDDTVRASLAKRIYKVRNALVHAKEGERPRYAPFAHDAELSQEIPLMRFVAEQIIIARGKVL